MIIDVRGRDGRSARLKPGGFAGWVCWLTHRFTSGLPRGLG